MGLTVAELIELLRSYPSTLRVLVDGYEEGFDDPSPKRIFVKEVTLDTGSKSWQRKHIGPLDLLEKTSDELEIVEAPVFHRESH